MPRRPSRARARGAAAATEAGPIARAVDRAFENPAMSGGLLVMALTGMMMFEMIRDIWTWDGPGTAAATIMDGIIGIIEGK